MSEPTSITHIYTPDELVWQRSGWGDLQCRLPTGEVIENVDLIPCFPLTAPLEWLSVVDGRGREFCRIEAWRQLPPAVRQLIEEELRERAFVPTIERVLRTSAPWPPCEWDIVTDRGPVTIEIDSEDDLRSLADGRVLVTAADNMRYQIPDFTALDATSRRLLRRYLG